ncbi:MAG: vWA domain-containing protein [Patescibacteria group bacterium]|nr:vWA domain-containing protein [Patescibacteria group bacterium]
MKEIVKRKGTEIIKSQQNILERVRNKSLEILSQMERKEQIILCVDVSGSMEGEKLKKAKEAIEKFYLVKERIDPNDQTAVVAFGGNVWVVSSFTTDRKSIKERLSFLQASGSTPMAEALSLSRKILREEGKKGTQKRIILLSDGCPTEPLDNPRQKTIEIARVLGEERVIIDTVGIGKGSEDFDEDLLKEIARITKGKYILVENLSQLPKVYIDLAQKKSLPPVSKFYLKGG